MKPSSAVIRTNTELPSSRFASHGVFGATVLSNAMNRLPPEEFPNANGDEIEED
jgi:hypothetical protein